MNNYSGSIFSWIYNRPVVSFALALLAFFGYSNVFIFGYLINVPVALRPFLDGYFYSTLALDFFVSVAMSGILSRLLLLLSRFFLANFPIRISNFLKVDFLVDFLETIFDIEQIGETLDRLTRVRLKIFARWVRQNRLILSIITGVVVFSIIFLGYQSLWYIPICITIFPAVWFAISRVELRRNFATIRNTSSMTPNRVASAAIGFSLIYFAICVFMAGFASFHNRMDKQVSIGMLSENKNSSLIAVTSSGVLVGEWIDERSKIPFIFPISAYFIPFDALLSVEQDNYKN